MDDCLIVGGGVIGLSLAYELAAAGQRVHVLERSEPGREASWAGAGILPPGNIASPHTAVETLVRLSHELHPKWSAQLREETGIDNEYRRCGAVYLERTAVAAAAIAQQARHWSARGIELRPLDAAGIAEVEPALAQLAASGKVAAAYFVPGEAQLRNPRHLRALVAACTARGVRITTQCTVEGFDIRGERVDAVLSDCGRHQGANVCITGGAWTRDLLARLGATIALKPIRGQIALLHTGTPLLARVVNEGPRYLVPRADGRVLVGSTEEDTGFIKQTTAEAIAELLRFATELVSALSAAALETCWAGLRPATPDGRPYLGPIPGLQNAFVAAGHFRHGLELSPATAVLLRQAILGQPTDVDLGAFRVDRS